MTAAFTGGLTVKRGDGGDPTEAFTAVTEVVSMSGLGKTNSLIDATSFDSSAKEYIAGLADGAEVSIECNRVQGDTQQDALRSDVDSGVTRNFEIVITDGTTSETYSLALVMLSWTITPQVTDKAMISFNGKISGAITVA
jgi:hypothetical protein